MSRALLATCALLAGAAVFGVYATAPDCEGWYCVASGDKPAAPQAVRSDAVAAAGTQGGGNGAGQQMFGSPIFDGEAEPSPDAAEAELTAEPMPLAEPQHVTAFDGFADDDVAAVLGREAETPAQRIAAEKAARKAADDWAALAATALEDPDPARRAEAIGGVGLHRHDAAVGVLLEVAATEPDPDNRYQALQSLWYSAADGLDRDGSIRTTLEQAAQDPDPQIAELAEKALKDLKALADAQAR